MTRCTPTTRKTSYRTHLVLGACTIGTLVSVAMARPMAFVISRGAVIPSEPYAARITMIGAAIFNRGDHGGYYEPVTMQVAPHYADVVSEVATFLQGRVAACEQQGIARERLLLDPGFGFGKSLAHNMQLLQGLPRLAAMGLPLVVGLSRKSIIGKLLGRDVQQRLPASLALAVLAAERGAAVIRTHDVAATADAVAMWVALEEWAAT